MDNSIASMEINDIPKDWVENVLGEDTTKRKSLAEVCGFSTDSKKIGKIENINSRLPQPVFEIMYDSRIVLIPIHEDLIKKIDKKNRIIYLDIPNGLLEII